MSQRKIKPKSKSLKNITKNSISELEGFKNAFQKLLGENKLLNGEASDVLEEILGKIAALEERVDRVEAFAVEVLEALKEDLEKEDA